MRSLVERLREGHVWAPDSLAMLTNQAADEIERLTAENDKFAVEIGAGDAEIEALMRDGSRLFADNANLREALELAIYACASPNLWLYHAITALRGRK